MTAGPAAFELLRDQRSFIEPLEAAIAAATAVLTTRQGGKGGPSARLFRAVKDHEALSRFVSELARHLASGTLHQLPPLRRGLSALPDFHHLTCGRFRGIFLVNRPTRQAIAMLFTEAPHRLGTRLEEIAQPYMRNPNPGKEPEDG